MNVRKYASIREATDRPNILMILLDTASARFLSCYGYPEKTTPFMDSLAAEGTRFASHYANAPWTPPSHASLFTGLNPIDHKMTHDNIDVTSKVFQYKKKYHFRGQFPTLASLLADDGYQTAGLCANRWVGSASNICYGFEHWDELQPPPSRKVMKAGKGKPAGERTIEGTLDWADNLRDPDKPYFVFANFLTPHLVRNPPAKYRRRFVHGRVPPYMKKITSLNCYAYLWNGWLKPEHMQTFIELYAALMAQTDDEIRRLIHEFAKRGLMDNTIVVITADHGDENGEHNLIDHQMCLYNTLIHVPMIAWRPGLVPGGRVEKRPTQHIDVAPTLLDLVGLKKVRRAQRQMKGADLIEEVPRLKKPRPIVAEHGVPRLIVRNMGTDVAPELYTPYLRRLKSIIYDGWKYIWSSDGADELYNLQRDHEETKNVIERHPDRARDLRNRLARWVRAHGETLERQKRRPRP